MYVERMYILIIWENSGTILFSLIKWENVLSKNMLTRFRCTCSAPHFWHVHSIYLDFKFIYKFKNTENVLEMCLSMLYTTQTLRVLHILGTGFLQIITNLSFCWKIQSHLTKSCTLIQVFLQIRQICWFLGLTDIC
jgi:hypothetical protein